MDHCRSKYMLCFPSYVNSMDVLWIIRGVFCGKYLKYIPPYLGHNIATWTTGSSKFLRLQRQAISVCALYLNKFTSLRLMGVKSNACCVCQILRINKQINIKPL